jgi:hypothetical protein
MRYWCETKQNRNLTNGRQQIQLTFLTPNKTLWTQRLSPNSISTTCCQRTRCRDLSCTTSPYWSILARTGGVGSHQVTTFPLESACLHMATRLVHHNYSQFASLLAHTNIILWLRRIQAQALYASHNHAFLTVHYYVQTKVQNLFLYERKTLVFFNAVWQGATNCNPDTAMMLPTGTHERLVITSNNKWTSEVGRRILKTNRWRDLGNAIMNLRAQ